MSSQFMSLIKNPAFFIPAGIATFGVSALATGILDQQDKTQGLMGEMSKAGKSIQHTFDGQGGEYAV